MGNKYKSLLDEKYAEHRHDNETSKLAFLADHVFNFTTYDDDIGEEMATDMIYVLSAIWQGKVFDYIEDRLNYRKYITMVNMPFLSDMIEWGSSVRGAWLDDCKDREIGCLFTVPCGELREFVRDIIIWGLEDVK